MGFCHCNEGETKYCHHKLALNIKPEKDTILYGGDLGGHKKQNNRKTDQRWKKEENIKANCLKQRQAQTCSFLIYAICRELPQATLRCYFLSVR